LERSKAQIKAALHSTPSPAEFVGSTKKERELVTKEERAADPILNQLVKEFRQMHSQARFLLDRYRQSDMVYSVVTDDAIPQSYEIPVLGIDCSTKATPKAQKGRAEMSAVDHIDELKARIAASPWAAKKTEKVVHDDSDAGNDTASTNSVVDLVDDKASVVTSHSSMRSSSRPNNTPGKAARNNKRAVAHAAKKAASIAETVEYKGVEEP